MSIIKVYKTSDLAMNLSILKKGDSVVVTKLREAGIVASTNGWLAFVDCQNADYTGYYSRPELTKISSYKLK